MKRFEYAKALEMALERRMTPRAVLGVMDEHEAEIYGADALVERAREELYDACVVEADKMVGLGYADAQAALEGYGIDNLFSDVRGLCLDWAIAGLSLDWAWEGRV